MSPTAPSSSYAAAAPEAHAAAAPPPAVSAAALAPFQSTSDSYHSQSQHHSHAVSAASSSIPSSSPPLRSRHGFSRPLAPLQVGSWVLMSCCIIIYYSLCIPFVPAGHHAEFYSFVFIYIAIFVPGFVAYIAGAARPAAASPKGATVQSASSVPGTVDAALPVQQPAANAATAATGVSLPVSDGASHTNGQSEQHTEQWDSAASERNQPTNGSHIGASSDRHQQPHTAIAVAASVGSSAAASPPAPVCSVCGALQPAGTKHCYIDGRCVPGFDHHCVYLNTCVGQRNYHLFFVFVSFVTALMTFQLFVTVWLLAHYQHEDYKQAVDTSRLKHPLAWLILLTILTVLPLLCLLSISTLQCFHCYLLGSRQTTYQFIIKRRQAMQQRWEQQQWQAEGRPAATAADGGPVLNAKQRWEQAEWVRERQRRQSVKQPMESHQQSHTQSQQQQQPQYGHTENGSLPAELPQLNEEIRSV